MICSKRKDLTEGEGKDDGKTKKQVPPSRDPRDPEPEKS